MAEATFVRYISALSAWSVARIFLSKMYQEEFVIRLICIGLLIPLSAFIFAGQKWAMSSAYTVWLCYLGGLYLFVDLTISVGLVAFLVFLGVLTLRSMRAADQLTMIAQKMDVQIFE